MDAGASIGCKISRAAFLVGVLGACACFIPSSALGLDEFRTLVGADEAHAGGATGAGVVVAIIDSGIDTDHPDLDDGDIVGQKCFCNNSATGGCCAGGLTESDSAEDDSGHGTRMAGVITSGGVIAPVGIAPNASVVAVKVLNAQDKAELDDVRRALQWIHDERPDVDVVNLSLAATPFGWPGYCDSIDATHTQVHQIVDALRERGTVVVAASGNNGAAVLAVPACMSNVIAVGAVWDGPGIVGEPGVCTEFGSKDKIACFSNYGVTLDLLSPGALTTTTALGGGASPPLGVRHGTSEAAAVVSGCAALLLGQEPSMSPVAVEAALEFTGKRLIDWRAPLFYPRIDCGAAVGRPELSVVVDDDFSSGLGAWDTPDVDGASATWEIVSGQLHGVGDGLDPTNGGQIDSFLVTTDTFDHHVSLGVDMQYVSGTVNPGDGPGGEQAYYVLIRYQDSQNYAYVKINPIDNCGACGLGPDVTIREVVGGLARTLDVVDIYPAGSSTWNRVTIELFDLNLAIFWNESRVFDEYLPFVHRQGGRIGLAVPEGTTVATAGESFFDDVEIAVPACGDGIDNDTDGLIDYPADPGCHDASGRSEAPACDDGADNDLDGFVDGSDVDCTARWRNSEHPQPITQLFDDFDDDDTLGWSQPDADGLDSSWRVVDGELQGIGDSSQAAIDSMLLADGILLADVVLDVDLRLIHGQANPGDGVGSEEAFYVILRFVDVGNYLYLKINPVNACGACGLGPDITVREVAGGITNTLTTASIYPTAVDPDAKSRTQSHLHLELTGSNLQLVWDGNEVFDAVIPVASQAAGKVGFAVPDGTGPTSAGISQFDNVFLVPEPASLAQLLVGVLFLLSLHMARARRSRGSAP